MWGALSDERTGLPFTIAAGPRKRSHTWVRVPRDSWPYFTVSYSRLPQPGGPGPRIYIPQEQGGPVIPSAQGPRFVASYDSQGYGGLPYTIIRVSLYKLRTDLQRKHRFPRCWCPFTERSHSNGRATDLKKASHVIHIQLLHWWAGCCLATSKFGHNSIVERFNVFRGFCCSTVLAWSKYVTLYLMKPIVAQLMNTFKKCYETQRSTSVFTPVYS
jgi:hypothetical protein